MTQAQEDALTKIKSILREHFDAGVVMVTAVRDDGVADEIADIRGSWHGGFAACVGLAHLAPGYMQEAEDEI